jgi:DNA-binding LytR/AlgR family response regulator
MYRVALCEDERVFSEAQEKICRGILEKLNIGHSISVFENSAAFWSAFSNGARYDLMLLDIVMGETDGLELARKIRGHDGDAAIVFITSSPEYAVQGYDVNALHYLMKPLDGEKLEKTIASDYERRFRRQSLIFKSGTQNLRIPVNDVICLESADRRVVITLPDGTADCSGKLSEMLESLPKDTFIRCHVGYIINLKMIKKLTRTEAVAVNGKVIPISRAYSQAVQQAFLKQLWEV